jgi:GNAT superfamily N-acetyltransferase
MNNVTEYNLEKFTPRLDGTLALVALGFGRKPSSEMRHMQAGLVRSSVNTSYRARQGGRDIAHLLCSPYGEVLWVNSAMVDPDHHNRGIGTKLMQHALGQLGSGYLALQTQTPAMYAAALKAAPDLYPALDGTPIPPDILRLYDLLFPRGNFPINTGVYGERLHSTPPSLDSPLAQQFYNYSYNGVDFLPGRGDSLVLIGKVANAG